MKKLKVAVIGCGNRGYTYSRLMHGKKEQFELSALCDINQAQIDKIKNILQIDNIESYTNPDVFFEQKRADLLVISTPDREHVPQAVRALKLGYDILLEKPVSDSAEELNELVEAQQKYGKKVIICHVLRYSGGFVKCKELLESGIIGRLYAIDASERVAYWHWPQAYVRGVGASMKLGHPAILAKCSHDLDLICYYANSRCESVSSIGGLDFFTPENAPEDSAQRCTECKHIDTCPYSAKRIYIDAWHKAGEPEFDWPYFKASSDFPHTEEKLRKGIEESVFGRCAFRCEVDMVDNQMVQMLFENGVKASLKMVYAAEPGRKIAFYGTLGEITIDEREDTITVMPFGGESEVVELGTLNLGGYGHGGGDSKMIDELYSMVTDSSDARTTLAKSVECHLMGIASEKSRLSGGETVKVH